MLSSNASDKEPCVDRKTPDKEFPEYEKDEAFLVLTPRILLKLLRQRE